MGQLTRHACVSEHNVQSRISPTQLFFFLFLFFFFTKTYNRYLVSFSNFVIVLINWLQDFASSNSVFNHTRNKQLVRADKGLML